MYWIAHEGQQSIIGSPSLRWSLQKQFSPTGSPQTGHFCEAAPLNCVTRGLGMSAEFIVLLSDAVGRSSSVELSMLVRQSVDHLVQVGRPSRLRTARSGLRRR